MKNTTIALIEATLQGHPLSIALDAAFEQEANLNLNKFTYCGQTSILNSPIGSILTILACKLPLDAREFRIHFNRARLDNSAQQRHHMGHRSRS